LRPGPTKADWTKKKFRLRRKFAGTFSQDAILAAALRCDMNSAASALALGRQLKADLRRTTSSRSILKAPADVKAVYTDEALENLVGILAAAVTDHFASAERRSLQKTKSPPTRRAFVKLFY
jgi:hypothetical protein